MKIRDKIITVMFCVFIGAMAILTAALPKKAVSENEKRSLADFPKFTPQSALSGKWESDFEGYISDHFPARETFAAADAYFMLATGRNGSNDIYKGRDGYLFTVFSEIVCHFITAAFIQFIRCFVFLQRYVKKQH